MSMEVSNYLVSWVVSYLGDLQPTCIGVIIYFLRTMDIPVIILTRQAGGYLDIRLPFGFAPECGAGSLEAGRMKIPRCWLCVCVV